MAAPNRVAVMSPPTSAGAALEVELRRLRNVMCHLPALLWVADEQLRLELLAGTLASRLSLEFVVGAPLSRLLATAPEAGRPAIELSRRALTGAGDTLEWRWGEHVLQLSAQPLPGDFPRCLAVAWDISELKREHQHARFLALTDPLTGLANARRLTGALLEEHLRSDRTGSPFAVLLIDLNGLKAINDGFGHHTGSRALCRLAHVLRETCRQTDLAARQGGDEFALVLTETDRAGAQMVARRVAEKLVADRELPRLSASVGIAVYPVDTGSALSLLEAADRDLYRDKQAAWMGRPRRAGLR